MTRFHLVSDLHLDHADMGPLDLLGDVLVLAGDTASVRYLEMMGLAASRYLEAKRPILLVAGNHEFYGHRMDVALRQMHRWARRHGIVFLHNRKVTICGVRVFGSTAWTDYEFEGGLGARGIHMETAARYLNDHRLIRLDDAGRKFTPQDALRAHQKAMRILDSRLGEPFQGPTVVITHHGVHGNSVAARFAGSDINSAFVSDLSAVIEEHQPAAWFHGHVHDSFDYYLGKTRVVANPRGYPLRRWVAAGEKMPFENASFREDLVIDVR
ncbi:metallophosphoesterase [Burkholderia cenocepacia]|uniref:metallophosphoesterase n=1 Tax=Burkholderia cenocepacia TaxID=95486 RepID=UPI000761DD38|nr:metallophosphoesterase [Burkholderia cenocepacia]KWU19192.1 hypothetical protein AS149_13170 [Burkholderia cenocepacia]